MQAKKNIELFIWETSQQLPTQEFHSGNIRRYNTPSLNHNSSDPPHATQF
eukprot:c37748_g1_i1 orf=16-165(-)